jgi:hypothetical protein
MSHLDFDTFFTKYGTIKDGSTSAFPSQLEGCTRVASQPASQPASRCSFLSLIRQKIEKRKTEATIMHHASKRCDETSLSFNLG